LLVKIAKDHFVYYQLNNIPFFMHNRNIKNHDKFTLMAYKDNEVCGNQFLNALEERQAVVSSTV
jgi:hypothetical protein